MIDAAYKISGCSMQMKIKVVQQMLRTCTHVFYGGRYADSDAIVWQAIHQSSSTTFIVLCWDARGKISWLD